MESVLEALGYGPARAIPVVNLTAQGLLVAGPGRLMGWSFRESGTESGLEAEGSAAAPAAGATIAQIAAVPPGLYLVSWTVELAGAVAAAEANNFALFAGAVQLLQSVNPAAVGNFPQNQVEQQVSVSSSVSVRAVGAATAGTTYSAQISVVPAITAQAILELRDGNSPLAEVTAAMAGSLTQWLGPEGIDFYNQVSAVPVSGLMVGAVYAAFLRF